MAIVGFLGGDMSITTELTVVVACACVLSGSYIISKNNPHDPERYSTVAAVIAWRRNRKDGREDDSGRPEGKA